jgi:hypothetical protein
MSNCRRISSGDMVRQFADRAVSVVSFMAFVRFAGSAPA